MYHGPKMLIASPKDIKKLTVSQTNNEVGKSNLKLETLAHWDNSNDELFKQVTTHYCLFFITLLMFEKDSRYAVEVSC